MIRLLLAFAVIVSLSGCASMDQISIPANLSVASTEKFGGVVVSVGSGLEGGFTAQTLMFRAKGSDGVGRITFVRGELIMTKGKPDFVETQNRGMVFFVALPSGEYEIIDVSFFINHGQFGSQTFSAREKFSIPFSVIDGRGTYLGEFISRVTYGRNVFGIRIPAGGYFVVSDRFDRDVVLLKRKADVGPIPATIQKSVVDAKAVALPLFKPGGE